MSFKPLLQKQKIRIDDHKRGAREIKNWDKKDIDIHLDKTTTYKVDGKYQEVRIKIPLNSDLPISVEYKGKKRYSEIPSNLKKEIKRAFEDKDKREQFIADLADELKNYDSILTNEEKARATMEKISKHFDLKWTTKTVATYVDGELEVYTEIYIDDQQILYFITIDKTAILIGEAPQYIRHTYKIRNKINS